MLLECGENMEKYVYPCMRKVESIAEIDLAIKKIKKRGWWTNLYISRQELFEYIADGVIYMFASKNSIILLREKSRFDILYFYTCDVEDFAFAVKQALKAVNKACVTDVIYKNNNIVELINVLISCEFEKRVIYERMVLKKRYVSIDKNSDSLTYAQLRDVNEIYELLYTTFDEFSDQLPNKMELCRAIENNKDEILIFKNDVGLLVSIFWFVCQGKSVHWKYWIIRPEFRGKGLGRRLVSCALSRYSAALRIVLWVRDNNLRAKALHEQLGFVSDDLSDCVLCFFPNSSR